MKKEKKLSQKLLPFFFLASLLPISLFACVTQFRMHIIMQKNMEMQVQASADKANQCLDMALDKYGTLLYDLCTDDDIIELTEHIIADQDALDVNSNKLRRELSHICNRNEAIEAIVMETAEKERIFFDRRSSSSVNSSWINQISFPEFEGVGTYVASGKEIYSDDGKLRLFQIVRRLVDYRDINKKIGNVMLHINVNVLGDAVNRGETNLIYICSGDTIISASNPVYIGLKISSIPLDNYQLAETFNEKSGWRIISCYLLDQYEHAVLEQTISLGLIAILSSVILMAFNFYFTRPIMRSINDMIIGMNRLEKGDFQTRVLVSAEMPSEFQQIGRGFNKMAGQISELMEQVRQAVLEQKNAEISALEAQIDPHFLYNTLDTINWKSIECEQYEISEMVGALADILRYTVKNAGAETTIEQELYWLNQYMLLQGNKLEQKLEVVTKVPDYLMSCKIHKLLLQPFVENAVKHGFYQKKETCILKILVEEAASQLHIVIKDNGKGLTQEQLDYLNDETADYGDHLGVTNVRKRLKLYYSEEGTVYFESIQGRYTKVHLFIPVIRGTNEEIIK